MPIGIDILLSGMRIDYNIYHERDGDFVLLCKDVILTAELISKFKKVTIPSNTIYIPKNQHKRIINDRNRLLGKEKTNLSFKGYAEIKAEITNLFNMISETSSVSDEAAGVLTDSVNTQLDTVEISRIIQTINSIREVDEYLPTHCVNVALLNGLMGKWMKLDKDDLRILIKIGLLHDIGKLKIPPEILNKPGKLTKDEFNVIKQHSVYSHEILKSSGYNDERILQGVIQHHEKVNGMGYPYGLIMDQITEFARITSISDVYDAMVAKRVYKEAHSPFEILDWFSEGCYSELDIKHVNTFLECMAEELKGKSVLLSNGKIGEVVYFYSMNFRFPIIRVGDEIINTTPDLYCLSLM